MAGKHGAKGAGSQRAKTPSRGRKKAAKGVQVKSSSRPSTTKAQAEEYRKAFCEGFDKRYQRLLSTQVESREDITWLMPRTPAPPASPWQRLCTWVRGLKLFGLTARKPD